jgi:hypothetical protein
MDAYTAFLRAKRFVAESQDGFFPGNLRAEFVSRAMDA